MQNDGKIQPLKSRRFFSESDKVRKLSEDANNIIPEQFALQQNFPNPFNPVTTIKFDIPTNYNNGPREVSLIVYDITGREASILLKEKLESGKYEINFNGKTFASGVYFYKIVAGESISVKRMILLK